MSRSVFRQRIEYLTKQRRPVLTLSEALVRLSQRALPRNAIVLTIDDGFSSVCSVAHPELRRFDLPYTLYVTSYYVQNQVPIFRLAVQYMFWKTSCKEVVLDFLPGESGKAVSLADPVRRQEAVRRCIAYGETECDETGRQHLGRSIAKALDADYETLENARLMSLMSFSELSQLAGEGADIQLHTHRHRFPADDLEEAEQEILDNAAALEPVARSPLVHFCYPSGEWSRKHARVFERRSIESATTCDPGFVCAETPMFELPRFLDRDDLSAVEFQSEVDGFAELLRRLRRLGKSGQVAS
jgi:peptidoglycan/xylan/chitin deacetylase (PgdA/CDA1 family)